MKKFFTLTLIVFTILFTVSFSAEASSGWGYRKNTNHTTPQIGKYEAIIQGTDSYYVGDTSKKTIYLTFDAGYDNGELALILDVLDQYHIPASFFMTGDFMTRFSQLTKRISDSGYLCCSHSMTHRNMTKLTKEEISDELSKLESTFTSTTGKQLSKFFRFPKGIFDRQSLETVQSLGYKSIFWSVAYCDWKTNDQKSQEEAIRSVVDYVHPGAIILMHTVSETNRLVLPKVIDALIQEGYVFASLETL
jgi:peptidoglycan-N-acetylmuramic acid deacetylase